MDISERLSEVIKENQNLKQQLKELRDKQGVSDEEFEEARRLFDKIDIFDRHQIWGKYIEVASLRFIFSCISLSEFVNKYKEYKNKQNEITVHDEVEFDDAVNEISRVMIITDMRDEYCCGICKNGDKYSVEKKLLHKTGEHYDSIDEFMKG